MVACSYRRKSETPLRPAGAPTPLVSSPSATSSASRNSHQCWALLAFSRSDAMRASRSDLECGGVTPEDRRYSERSDSTDALRLFVPLVVAAGVLWTMRAAVAAAGLPGVMA